jgi:hypothetical protein
MAMEVILVGLGISVAGLAAVVGIWMERDPRRPPRWAWALSILILMATGVTVFQSYLEVLQGEKMEEDMARMLQQLDKLAASSDDPKLQAFVTSELNAQARANPDIVEKLADRVEDDGGDAADMLSKHMSDSEVANLAKSGKVKKKKKSSKPKPAEEPKPVKKTATSGDRDRGAETTAPKTPTAAPAAAGDGRGRGEEAPAEAAEEATGGEKSPRGAAKTGLTAASEEEDKASATAGGEKDPRGSTGKTGLSKTSKTSKSGAKKTSSKKKKSAPKKPR